MYIYFNIKKLALREWLGAKNTVWIISYLMLEKVYRWLHLFLSLLVLTAYANVFETLISWAFVSRQGLGGNVLTTPISLTGFRDFLWAGYQQLPAVRRSVSVGGSPSCRLGGEAWKCLEKQTLCKWTTCLHAIGGHCFKIKQHAPL